MARTREHTVRELAKTGVRDLPSNMKWVAGKLFSGISRQDGAAHSQQEGGDEKEQGSGEEHGELRRARARTRQRAEATRSMPSVSVDNLLQRADAAAEEEALERALQQRPEILALRVASEAQRLAARAAAGGRYPQIIAQGNVEYSNPNPLIFPQQQVFRSSWDVSAVIRWSPDETVASQRKMETALAELRRIEADETALRDALRVEVAQAHRAFEAAKVALEAARVGLEAAEESYRVRVMQLEAGAAVTRDLIDAESDLTRARLEMVGAVIGIRQARVALDYATGEYAARASR